ncbi:hypothetical protein HPP92_020393 [Vanilla planifolia]|uniref:Core Histone H2A/H2B/H3 domain-containing protein n=1 Tax=Vanilla planifolia TaxID=51239 RepID=A0A835UHK0_VANPL|nr:hypothetical protein HPP92_020393 [Vanilla planifolia]
MAPKRSRKLVGTVVKTTRKVVEAKFEMDVDAGDVGASQEQPKLTEILVEENAADGVPVVVVLPTPGKETEKGKQGKKKEGNKEKEVDVTPEKETEHRDGDAVDREGRQEAGEVKQKEENRKKKEQGRKRRRRRRWSNAGATSGGYKRYVFRVLKQVHPEMGASARAMSVLEGMMVDMFDRIAEEAGRLGNYVGRATLSSREIQDAVRLVLPGELCKHAVAEGMKAVANYMDAGRGG